MTQEEKSLLLQDLCARLPYEVKVHIKGEYKTPRKVYTIYKEDKTITYFKGLDCFEEDIENVKPYLRPMSSMTEEERKELNNQGYAKIAGEFYHYCALSSDNAFYNPERHPYVRMEYVIKLTDWLNAHHFDYRGLIFMGLALEAPEDMY